MRHGFGWVEKNMFSDFLREWRCVAAMFVVFAMGVCGAWGKDYYWINGKSGSWTDGNNWSYTKGSSTAAEAYPSSKTDIAYFYNAATVEFPTSGTVTVGGIMIYSGDNTVTFNLNGCTLNIGNSPSTDYNYRLNIGSSSGSNETGHLVINGSGTVTTYVLDSINDNDSSLTLNNDVDFTVSNTIYANGSATTTITGDNTCTFTIPSSYNNSYNNSGQNILKFEGSMSVTSTNDGYTCTLDKTPAIGGSATITVVNTNSNNFSTLSYAFTSGRTNITFGGTGVPASSGTITFDSYASTQTITITVSSITASGTVINFTLKNSNSNQIGQILFTAKTADTEYVWTGSSGDGKWSTNGNWKDGGAPTADSINVSIPYVADYPTVTLDGVTASLSKLTIASGMTLDCNGHNLTSTSIDNSGTIKFNGSETVNATTKLNESGSTIEYTGDSATSVWGENYYNLTVSGAALTFNNSANVTNKITCTKNSTITVTVASGYTLTADTLFCETASVAVALAGNGAYIGDTVDFRSGSSITASIATVTMTDSTDALYLYTGSSATIFSSNANIYKVEFTGSGNTLSTLTVSGTLNCTTLNSNTDNLISGVPAKVTSGATSVVVSDGATFKVTGAITNQISIENNGTIKAETLTGYSETYPCVISNTSSFTADSFSAISITNSGTLTATTSLSATKISSNTDTISVTGGALSVSGITKNDTNGTITASGCQTYKNAVTNAGTITVGGVDTGSCGVDFQSTYTGTNGSLVGCSTSDKNPFIDFKGDVTFGTFTANDDVVRFLGSGTQNFTSNGNICSSVVIGSSSASKTPTVKLQDSLTASDITIDTGSTLNSSYLITCTGDLTNTGSSSLNEVSVTGTTMNTGTFSATTATFGGNVDNSGGTSFAVSGVTTIAPATSITITGTATASATSFETLNCNVTSAATLNISNSITVTTLSLTGAEGQLLTIAGSGSINLTTSQSTGKYLSVGNSVKIYESTGSTLAGSIYSASYSVPSAGTGASYYSEVLANRWNLFIGTMTYVWNGVTSTDWGTSTNWESGVVPGISANSTDGVDVEIPKVASGKYPEVGATYSIAKLTIGTSSDSEATVTLSTSALTVTGTLTNYGTIIYTRDARITSNGIVAINDVLNKGTVEYAGTPGGTITNFSGTGYYNLVVSSGVWTDGGEITVSNNLTVSGGSFTAANALAVSKDVAVSSGTLTTNKNFTVTNALSVSGDASVLFNATSGTTSATSAATATFSTSGSVSFGNDSDDSFELTGGTLELITGTLSLAGTITASGGITLSKNATLAANTTFASAVTLGTDVTLSGGTYTATFENTVGGSTAYGLTIGADGNATNAVFKVTTGGTGSLLSYVTVYGTTGFGSSGDVTITTTGAQMYTGDATLNQNTVLIADTDTVTFGGKLNGAASATQSLTIGSGSYATAGLFGGIVGGSKPLLSLYIYGATTFKALATAVTTSGLQTYASDVVLAVGTKLTSSDGAITFGTSGNSNSVTGAYAFAVATSGDVLFNGTVGTHDTYLGSFSSTGTGSVIFSGAVYAASVSVAGTSAINGASVTTTDAQSYTDAVTTDDSILTLTTSDSTYGTIYFGNAVNATTLFLNAAANVTQSNTSVITATNLLLEGSGVYTLTSANSVGTIAAASGGSSDGAISFTNSAGLVVGTVNSVVGITRTGAVTIDTNTFALAISNAISADGGFTQTDGAAGVALNANVSTSNKEISFADAVTLSGTTITVASGTATTTFSGAVDGGVALVISGAAKFGGIVGATTALTSITVSGITTIATTGITTSGTQKYTGAVTLGVAAITLKGTTVEFVSTVDNATALTVTGNAVFGGKVGDNANLTSLSVSGTSSLNGASVATTGAQTYTGAVTFGTALASSSFSSGSGDILFGSTVDGGTAATTDVLINSTGTVTFTGAVGGTSLQSLTVGTSINYATSININGGSVITSGAQKYYGPVSLGAATDESFTANSGSTISFLSTLTGNTKNVTFNNANVSATGEVSSIVNLTAGAGAAFENTVSLSGVITVTGAASYSGNVSAASLEDKSTTTFVKAITVTTSSTQKYDGNTTLKEATILLAAENLVTFSGTVGGGYSLTIGSSTNATDVLFGDSETDYVNDITALVVYGDATFKGIVGNTTALGSIFVTGTTSINTSSIATTGTQTYNGDATLGTDTTLLAVTSAVTFNSNVIGANHSLSIGNESNATDVVFGTSSSNTVDAIANLTVYGNAVLNSLFGNTTSLSSINITGSTTVNGGFVKTSGNQTYGDSTTDAVTLGVNTTFTSTGASSAMTFNGTVDATSDGGQSLTIISDKDTGTVVFKAAVGKIKSLGDVKLTGVVTFEDCFIQGVSKTYELVAGKVTHSEKEFIGGKTTITAGKFIQTGENTDAQSIASIDIKTGATMDWDSTDAGGTLGIGGNYDSIVQAVDEGSLNFHKKNIVFSGNVTLKNVVLFDLIVSNTGNVTQDGNIRVRRHVAVKGTYTPNTSYKLILGNDSANKSDSSDSISSGIATIGTSTSSFGNVVVYQGSTEKTFGNNTLVGTTDGLSSYDSTSGNFSCETLTISETLSSAGSVTFNSATITTVTNDTSSFAINVNTFVGSTDSQTTIITNDCTLNTTGMVTIGSAVGDIATFNGGITHSAGTTNVQGSVVTSNGNVLLGSSSSGIVLTGATTISTSGTSSTTGTVKFSGAVKNTSSHDLTVDASNGTVTFSGTVGDSTTSLGALSVTAQGGAYLAADITASSVSFNKTNATPVTLTGDVKITTSGSNGTVDFGSTVDSGTSSRALTISSGTGVVTFTGKVGSTYSLGNLTSSDRGAVSFAETVKAEEINITGDTTFANTVDGTSVAITGTTLINGSSITTTGAQSYKEAVTVGNSSGVTLTSRVDSGVQAITFSSTVNSSSGNNYALEISTTGNTSFNDTVGNVDKLSTLSVGGTTSVNTSAITTTGEQTYTGNVTVSSLLTSTTLTAKNASDVNQVITFTGSFDGGSTAVNLVGTVTFGTIATNTTSNIGTLTITGDTTNNSTLSSLTSTASVAITGIVANNGVLNCGAGTITIVGNTTNTGTVNGGTSAISLTGDFTNSGTLSYGTSETGTFTLTGNFTNSGTFTCGKSTVIFTGLSSDNTSEITGKNTFYNLTLDTSTFTTAKTVVFPAGTSNEQTVNGKFTVSGNETSKIILTSATEQTSPSTASASDRNTWWYISTQAPSSTTVEVTNAEIRYAYSKEDISNCVSSSTDYIVGNSWTTYHWFGSHKYYWIGTSNDNAWQTAGNWYSDSSGTNQMSAYPLQNDETAEVVIVKGDVSTSVSGNQLVLTSSDSSQIILKSFTLNSGVRADISSHKISAVESIKNNGILAIDGSNATPLYDSTTGYIPNVTHANSDNGVYSTIEYYSNTSGITNATTYAGLGLSSNDGYVNLKINVPENATYSDTVNDVVKVSKDFTVVNLSTVSAKEISVTGDSSIKGGAVTTTGNQSYTGAVAMGGNEDFEANSGSGTITIVTSINSATANGDVEFNGNVVLANTDASPTVSILSGTGTVTFDKTVTGSGQALALSSNSTTLPAVLFSGVVGESNTYLGAINSSGTGAVEFDSAVYASSMTVTGDTTCNSSVATTGAISITGNAIYKGAVSAASLYDNSKTSIKTSTITTSGTQKYTGAVTLDVATIGLSGTTVEFVSTVDNATALTVTGNAVFGDVVGNTANLTSLRVSGTSSLNGASVATTGTQTYNGDATLGVDTTLLAGTSTAKFNSNVVGSGHSLSVGNGSNATDVVFGTDENDSVNGVTSLKVFGDATFNSLVGNSVKLSSIEVSLTTLINSSSIATAGGQTYTDAVTFGLSLASSSLSSGSGDILFGSAVDGGTAATTDVLISSIGNITFTGVVGGTSLKSLTVGTSENYTTLININGGSVITSGTQTYYGPVSLGISATELKGNNIECDSTVNGSSALTVTGNVKFGGNVGNTANLISVEVTGGTTFGINSALSITTTGTQKYIGNATLAQNTTLLAAENLVTFSGTVGGGYSLTIGSSTNATDVLFGDSESDYVNDITALTVYGDATFKGIVGNTTALGTINVELTSALNTSSITTTGTQTYNGGATLGTDTTLLAGTSAVTFNSNVIGASHSLSVGNNSNATDVIFGTDESDSVNAIKTLSIFGDSTFNSLVGNTTALGTIAVSLTSNINTSAITTTGAQTYSGAVTLLTASSISAGTTEAAEVLFSSTVDGAFDLSFTNSTFVKFNGAVGSTSAIKSLTTTGATYFENDFTQDQSSIFAITSGNVCVDVNRFVSGALSISTGATFTQTGANDSQSNTSVADDYQSVQSIENNGTCIWDSASNGGYLTLNGSVTGDNASYVLFNKKNVTVGATLTLSGVFYNLIIPTGLTVTNGSGICVRNDFTINGSYKDNSKLLTLGWITVDSTTYESGTTGIISDNGSTSSSLGKVNVTQGVTPKTFSTAITASSIDMSDSATGPIKFDGSLVVATLINGSSSVATSFDILFNANTSVAEAITFYTTGVVTLGNGGSAEDSISFAKGVAHETGVTNISCALSTTDSNIVFGSSTNGIDLTGASIILTNGTSSTTGTVIFNGTIYNETSYPLTIDSKVGTVTFNEAVGSDSVELGDIQIASSTSITADKTISSSKVTLTGGAVNLNGAVVATNGFTSTGSTFDNTRASVTTTDSAILITHTADENIGGPLSSGNGKISLSSDSTIEILTAVNSTAGNILVDSDSATTISSSGDIVTTTGNVIFGSVKAGALSTAGDITTSGVEENGTGSVTFTNATTLTSNVVIKTSNESTGGYALFKNIVEGASSYASNLSIETGTGSVEFCNNFGTSVSNALGDVKISCGNLTVDSLASSSYANSFEVTQSEIYHQQKESSITVKKTFAQNDGSTDSTSLNQIAGTIASGTGTSFASTTYYDEETALSVSSGTVSFGNDVHIALPTESQSMTVSSSGIAVSGNFILYSGKFIPNSNISISKDFILLGTNDNSDAASTVSDLYSYANSGRNTGSVAGTQTTAAVNASLSSIFPDGSSMPTSYSGVFDMTNFEGRVIKCGKNFYDNGVDLICATQWTLKIPANNNAYDYFAESYNMSVKNSLVLVNTAVTPSGTIAKISASENCTDEGNNTDGDYANSTSNNVGWDFTHLSIKKVATINDDILCITFTEPVENSNGEITTALTQIFYDSGAKIFAGVYSDSSCTTALGTSDTDKIYLKTTDGESYRWNTDATGLSSGNTESTDKGRSGVSAAHRSVVPNIQIIKATSAIYATLRDAAKNRIYNFVGDPSDAANANLTEGARYTGTVDNCSPVLVAVYTGQELHTDYDSTVGATSQAEYDSHNFIEFQYSESVNIGDIPAVSADTVNYSDIKNIRTSTSFASTSEHGGAIIDNTSGITVKGFADIASGEVTAGERTFSGSSYTGAASTTVHSLYRKFSTTSQSIADDIVQTHRVRISVAGFVDGTVTSSDNYLYNNWNGYITSSTMPSGQITRVANSFITDIAVELDGTAINNSLDSTGNYNSLPMLDVNSYDVLMGADANSNTSLYGTWDVLHPVFAPYVDGSVYKWETDGDDSDRIYEIVGTVNNTTSAYLQRIEFHLFDNSQNYSSSDKYQWRARNGWVEGTTLIKEVPDVIGGSRLFTLDNNVSSKNQTTGGIRYSSLDCANSAFTYQYRLNSTSTSRAFGNGQIEQKVRSSIYRNETQTSLDTKNDGLYISIPLNESDTELTSRTSFIITYTPDKSFITDMAGNRLLQTDNNSSTKTLTSIDVTPPAYTMTMAPVSKNQLYVVFSKQLAYDGVPLSSSTDDTTMSIIADQFEFALSDNENIDEATYTDLTVESAKFEKGSSNYTGLTLTLNKNITLENVKHLWLRIKKGDFEATGIDGVVNYPTFIEDSFGNYMDYHSCHAISDFALHVVKPVYAYDISDSTDGSTGEDAALHTIRDFSGDGTNNNRLLINKDVMMQVKVVGGTDSSGDDIATTDKAIIFFDRSIDSGSASDLYNKQTDSELKVWLPTVLEALATNKNTPEQTLAEQSVDEKDSSLRYYYIPDADSTDSYNWKANDIVQFVVGLKDSTGTTILIDQDGDASTEKVPLYALRLGNDDDASSIDIWQFRMVAEKLQRGGVSILNNVINSSNKETTVIQVDSDAGNLIIAVMTLDGNIIKYLEHGNVEAGTHYYRWNGTNNAGKAVARGLYFVRVIGEGIDETRKVMVVK